MDLNISGDGEKDDGIILGCWDHENTFSLIRELEETVNTAEKKCTALMQELVNYRRYYEEWSSKKNNTIVINLKKEKKKSGKNGKVSNSISDNSIARKSLIDGDQLFYKKLKTKISEVNDEITYANMKIGFKNNVLLPTEEYKENLRASVALGADNNLTPVISFDSEKFEDYCSNSFKLTKSDPILRDKDKNKLICKNDDCSKITKDELALYQNLSSSYIIGRDNRKGESRRKMRSKSLQCAKESNRDKIELTASEPFFINQRKNLSADKINKAPSENDMPLALLSSASRTLNIGENIEECISHIKEKIQPNVDATLNVTVPEKCMKAISDLLVSGSTNTPKNFSKISSSADNCNNLTKAVNLIFGSKPEPGRKQRFKHTSGGLKKQENFEKGEKKKGAEGDRGRNFKEELTAELSAVHNDFLNLHKKYSSLREKVSKNMDNRSTLNSIMKLKANEYGDLVNYYAEVLSSKPDSMSKRKIEDSDQIHFHRNTSAWTLTKVLRQIQTLQDKIKEMD